MARKKTKVKPSTKAESEMKPQDATDENVEASNVESEDDTSSGGSELDEMRDRLQRKVAELENFRKLTEKRMSDSLRYMKQDLLRTVLPVMDNFESLMKAVDSEQDPKMIIAGFGMIREQLSKFLSEHDVKIMESLGAMFNPEQHDAIGQEEREDEDPNRILRVAQEGYTMGEKVIRPARVTVSTPPTELSPEEPDETEDVGDEPPGE